MPKPSDERAEIEQALEESSASVHHGLVAALRYREDEVQWGRSLSAVLQRAEPCRAFVEAVLAQLEIRRPGAGAGLRPVPEDVASLDENVLRGRPSRRLARKSTGDRVDLTFSSRATPGWRLHVELKINHKLTQAQAESYGRDALVLAVVRDPAEVSVEPETPGWLGAVGWSELLEALRRLPVSPSEAVLWQQLLDVMVADGDLLVKPVISDEARAAQEIMDVSKGVVLEHAARRLSRQAEMPVARLRDVQNVRVFAPSPRDPWTGLSLEFGSERWWYIALHGLYWPAPEVQIWFYPSPDRRSARSARTAVEILARGGQQYERFAHGYRWRSYERKLHAASADELTRWICSELDGLRRAGVYNDELSLRYLRTS